MLFENSLHLAPPCYLIYQARDKLGKKSLAMTKYVWLRNGKSQIGSSLSVCDAGSWQFSRLANRFLRRLPGLWICIQDLPFLSPPIFEGRGFFGRQHFHTHVPDPHRWFVKSVVVCIDRSHNLALIGATTSRASTVIDKRGMQVKFLIKLVWCGVYWCWKMEETKVIYHIDDEDTPYLVKLPKSPVDVTLSDFKNVLNRPSYKFFFKSMDDDFGWVCVPNVTAM